GIVSVPADGGKAKSISQNGGEQKQLAVEMTARGNPQEQRIPTFTTATAAVMVPGAAVHTQPHSNNNIPRWAGITAEMGQKKLPNPLLLIRLFQVTTNEASPQTHEACGSKAPLAKRYNGMVKASPFVRPLSGRWASGASPQTEPRMTLPHSVAAVLKEHVSLEVESIDRMYLNVYVPPLQS